MDYSTFQSFVILLGAALALLVAVMQMLLVKKEALNYLILIVCLNIVVFHLSSNFFIFTALPGWHTVYAYVRVIGVTASLTLLPLTFFWLRALLYKELRISSATALHFLPAVLTIVLMSVWGRYPPNPSIPPELYNTYLFQTNHIFRISSLITLFQTVVYVCWILIIAYPVIIKATKEKKSNLYAALLLAFFMVLSIGVYIDNYIGNRTFTLVMQSRMTIFITLIFVASFRYPFVLNIIKLEAYRDEYTNSRISGIDSDAIVIQLDALMESEKIYQDATLKIQRLAKIIGIPAYQLSEIFNTKIGMNFPQYLKNRRVEAAKALIRERPEDKLLSIAFDCGFNSLSSFNESFKAITGMTPSQYRSRCQFAEPD